MTFELEQFIEKAQLPSSIEAVANLQQIIAKDISSAHDFATEIQTDAGLTARIMRLANSAFYGSGMIDNIEQAIILIGEDGLVALTISTEVIEALQSDNCKLNMHEFWQENIFSAVSTKIIDRRIDRPKSHLFTCTLLRRIGWLTLWRAFPDMAAQIQTQHAMHRDKKPHIVELSSMGDHHAALTSELLKHWQQLPEIVHEPIHHYLEPIMASPEHQQDAAIIYLTHQHMSNYFGLLEPKWIDNEWLNTTLTVPIEALLAEADMEVHAHYNHMQGICLGKNTPLKSSD